MNEGADITVTNPTTRIRWNAQSRVAHVAYERGAKLTEDDATFLATSLRAWIGTTGEPFAVLADGAGLETTDAAYRAGTSRFFREHRAHAFIALVNLAPVIHVVVEMFRIGTAIQLRSFGDEGLARAWLRTKGIRA